MSTQVVPRSPGSARSDWLFARRQFCTGESATARLGVSSSAHQRSALCLAKDLRKSQRAALEASVRPRGVPRAAGSALPALTAAFPGHAVWTALFSLLLAGVLGHDGPVAELGAPVSAVDAPPQTSKAFLLLRSLREVLVCERGKLQLAATTRSQIGLAHRLIGRSTLAFVHLSEHRTATSTLDFGTRTQVSLTHALATARQSTSLSRVQTITSYPAAQTERWRAFVALISPADFARRFPVRTPAGGRLPDGQPKQLMSSPTHLAARPITLRRPAHSAWVGRSRAVGHKVSRKRTFDPFLPALPSLSLLTWEWLTIADNVVPRARRRPRLHMLDSCPKQCITSHMARAERGAPESPRPLRWDCDCPRRAEAGRSIEVPRTLSCTHRFPTVPLLEPTLWPPPGPPLTSDSHTT